jgi:hypothetical protein
MPPNPHKNLQNFLCEKNVAHPMPQNPHSKLQTFLRKSWLTGCHQILTVNRKIFSVRKTWLQRGTHPMPQNPHNKSQNFLCEKIVAFIAYRHQGGASQHCWPVPQKPHTKQ